MEKSRRHRAPRRVTDVAEAADAAERDGQTRHEKGTDKRPGSGRAAAYDIRAVEAKWRERWEEEGTYRADITDAARPYYNLMMFPYPSAEGLHVGNMYSYVGSDVHGRFMAMQGHDVFEPVGFDAFGIHSENFAIKRGVHPRGLTAANIEQFRRQLKSIGNRFDWSHEVVTTDPSYYRWTQWVFVTLFKAGLVERKSGAVNWCPTDKTVLADEQVIAGRCERCGSVVERRVLQQWFLRITAYADRLLDNLDRLDWSERVKAAQRNWIGRSEGLEFSVEVAGTAGDAINVFTTRPDTIYGVTYVALAPEHPMIHRIVAPDRADAVRAYQEAVQRRRRDAVDVAARPVTGVFTGAYGVHPVTRERVPIYVADYVLLEYGTGAIMGVPAHDGRDWDFAHAMGLPIRPVVAATAVADSVAERPFTEDGVVFDSGAYSGLSSSEARARIGDAFAQSGIGRRQVRYHLRDWLVSRQRYWGTPIPIIYCAEHGAVPVPEEHLPVLLPEVEDYRPVGAGVSPLANIAQFVETRCPVCGGPARRETDVCDNLFDSSWYYLRYPSSDDDERAWNPEVTRKWLPVDMYIGGAEHSVMHLLYTRFVAMALHDLEYLAFEEPFRRFRANGTITKDGAKISKSKGNVINPDEYIERVGADVFRTQLLFAGPYESGGDFSDRGLSGVVRFMERFRTFVLRHAPGDGAEVPIERRRLLHQLIQHVTEDMEALKYNTAIAAQMAYLNAVSDESRLTRSELQTMVKLLAPIAPFATEELWERLGGKTSVHHEQWPAFDATAAHGERATIIVQVNGKLRDKIVMPAGASDDTVTAGALASERVQRAVQGQRIQRVVYVPGRLVNIVAQ